VLLPLVKELRDGFEISEQGYWISEHGRNMDYWLLWMVVSVPKFDDIASFLGYCVSRCWVGSARSGANPTNDY
jgi:hypothetical protein